MLYHRLFNTVFRRMDPEAAHELAFCGIRFAGAIPGVSSKVRDVLSANSSVSALGLEFPGVLGVAGGFDKNAQAVRGLRMLGFGYVEVGTVTAQAQDGNEKPRLWRHLDQRAIRNRMGFNNQGATAVARRLARLRRSRGGADLIIGVNIGKTKVTPATEAAADYAASARKLGPYASYVVVNVSSPNTPGLRDLQSVQALEPILSAVRHALDDVGGNRVPLLVKIAPDLADQDVDEVAELVTRLELDGVVAVNTTIGHDYGEGGLSGPPVRERGLAVVARLRAKLGEGPTIIGVGGITTLADAEAYLAAGATLLQGYTAFIYEGPLWASRINRGLAQSRSAVPGAVEDAA